MSIPEAMTDNAFASMGGNAMHVQIVGAAMVLAMCLVDWTKPDAARGFSDLETVCQTKQAINANKAKTKRKATASWKKTEQALLARFGLAQTTVPNKKRATTSALPAKSNGPSMMVQDGLLPRPKLKFWSDPICPGDSSTQFRVRAQGSG